MRNYFLRISVLICTLFSFSFTQDVVLSIDGSSLNYESTSDIYGFQFDHDGCATGTSGGDATANGFMVSASSGTVLGFSMTGGFIPAGSGVLVDLGSSDCTEDVLTGLVFSGAPPTVLTSGWSEGGDDDGGGVHPCDELECWLTDQICVSNDGVNFECQDEGPVDSDGDGVNSDEDADDNNPFVCSDVDGDTSVSYTHQTLPTICRV